MSTEVQSVIFDKSKYNVTKAKKWLRDNDFVAPKVDKTDRYLRFRQKEPSYFDESSFRTIPFGKGTGIKAIIGVPMKKNPFDEALDPDGAGHRIGAYAMLFQKHRANAKAIEKAGGKGSVEHALEVSKAHEYWNLYQDARESYDPIAKREKRMFNELTLHQKYNDFNSAMNYKLRNNPMKTRKNPVIDGKTIVDNLQGLRKQIRKSYTSSSKKLGMEQIKYDIVSIWLALKKLDSLGRPVQYKVFSGKEKGKPYIAVIYDSGMGCILFLITSDGKGSPKGTIKYLGYDEDDYELSVGVPIDSLLEHFGDIVDQTMDAPFFDEDLEESVQEAPSDFIDMLSEYVVEDKDLKKAEYEVKPYKKNPHCHCYGHKKNPHCPTHGNKKNPLGTAYRQGVMSGLAYRFNPTKKIMSFESFMDNLADGNVFVGRYVIFVQDGVPMRLEIGSSTPKEVSPEVAFYADLAGQAELVGTSDIDAFSDDYRGLIRQASDASSGGFVSGGGVDVVDVVETGVGSKDLDDLARDMAMEISIISNEFAAYARDKELSGMQQSIANMESIRKRWIEQDLPMTMEAREIIYRHHKHIPPEHQDDKMTVLNLILKYMNGIHEDRRQFEIALDNIEKIIKIEAPMFAKEKDVNMLDKLDDKLKKSLKKFALHFNPEEKRILNRIRSIAGNKRIKTTHSITEKILEKFKSIVEKYTGSKVDLVDDKTGKKTTPEKQATQIIEEVKADPNYRPQFDMQRGFVEGSVIQTPFVFKAPFEIPEEAEEDDFMKLLKEMQESDAAFKAQFKNNPRGSHYAYRMSTLDHDHRIDRTRLNNVFIKKNPEMNKGDEFRFPQTTVLNVPIDFDIYQWLSGVLSDYDKLIMLATKNPKYAKAIPILQSLKKSNDEFIVRMQTEIVPAVEAKVKKQLASGKTLKDILGSSKKNPKRTRRNTKRRRRYY